VVQMVGDCELHLVLILSKVFRLRFRHLLITCLKYIAFLIFFSGISFTYETGVVFYYMICTFILNVSNVTSNFVLLLYIKSRLPNDLECVELEVGTRFTYVDFHFTLRLFTIQSMAVTVHGSLWK